MENRISSSNKPPGVGGVKRAVSCRTLSGVWPPSKPPRSNQNSVAPKSNAPRAVAYEPSLVSTRHAQLLTLEQHRFRLNSARTSSDDDSNTESQYPARRVQSVESLLELRRDRPEEILEALGFGTRAANLRTKAFHSNQDANERDVLRQIPDRFFRKQSFAKGVDVRRASATVSSSSYIAAAEAGDEEKRRNSSPLADHSILHDHLLSQTSEVSGWLRKQSCFDLPELGRRFSQSILQDFDSSNLTLLNYFIETTLLTALQAIKIATKATSSITGEQMNRCECHPPTHPHHHTRNVINRSSKTDSISSSSSSSSSEEFEKVKFLANSRSKFLVGERLAEADEVVRDIVCKLTHAKNLSIFTSRHILRLRNVMEKLSKIEHLGGSQS